MSEPSPVTAWSSSSRSGQSAPSAPEQPAPEQDAVLLFLGGPLDGRVEVREARHGAPLPTITHVHLHDGPKVVHHYDLQPLADQAGVYHLRPPTETDGVDGVDEDPDEPHEPTG